MDRSKFWFNIVRARRVGLESDSPVVGSANDVLVGLKKRWQLVSSSQNLWNL